jgi:lipopolysaccharide transport protein LptA
MSSMLQQDQPVNVTANNLDYDGAASTATYTENAQLWQGDMSIKADSIVVDNMSGDLAAAGSVTTATLLDQEGENKKKERVRSMATAKDFKYEESLRRATYVGDAHMSGPQGDMTAAKIELYLKPSGDELERAEAYDGVTLRERNRKTTGNRMTYFEADERYVVTGTPVAIVDECGSETTGRTVTFYRTTDRVVVDGNEQIRTRTKSGAKCP